MITIHKYQLNLESKTQIDLPLGAEVLSVGCQKDVEDNFIFNQLFIWIKLETKEGWTNPRYFKVYGTGQKIDSDFQYRFIGTIQTMQGLLIWHVFEEFLKVKP